MISPFSYRSGFTLIELLIVLTISMTAVALVGGLSLDFVKKYQTQAEVKTLTSALKKAGDLAFIIEQPVSVSLTTNSLALESGDKMLLEKSFEHLSFTPTNFIFSAMGQPSVGSLTYSFNGRVASLSLWTLSNET
jgi:prepilin-type N-terminal cleavage/methylation domain-containing protein